MAAFKDMYSVSAAKRIARAIHRAHPPFSEDEFLRGMAKALKSLELKDRMKLIEMRIHAQLGDAFSRNAKILLKSLQQNENDDVGLRGFEVWPLTEFIAVRGLGHFDESMAALKEMTKVFTAEFAIRRFLIKHESKSLKLLAEWTKDENEHVRRLVSEGTRPFLPWGERLHTWRDRPELAAELLERLVNDPSAYVRKSVANHMNDHTKTQSEWAVKTLTRWSQKHPESKEVARLVKHASRSLLKQGHEGAIALHGFGNAQSLAMIEFKWGRSPAKILKFGGQLQFTFEIKNTSRKSLKIMADYAVFFKKSNGELSPKVFKAAEKTLAPGSVWRLEIKHKIVPISTRKYYPGPQKIEPRINGKAFEAKSFRLQMP